MKAVPIRALTFVGGLLALGACTALVELPEPGSNTATGAGGQGATATTSTAGGASSTGGAGAGAGGATTSTGGEGGAAGPCPLEGPTSNGATPTPMALIADPNDGDYCVDTLEVTFAQYNAYLLEGGVDYVQDGTYDPQHCAWNQDATPPAGSGFDGWWNRVAQETFEDDYAVRLVDWCDAKAYCSFYGKRLCGMRGGGAPRYDQTLTGTELATDTEWGFACGAGVNTYPMGTQPPAAAQSCQDAVCATWPDNADCGTSQCGSTNVEAALVVEGSNVCLDGKNQCTKMCTDNWLEMGAPVGSHPDCHGVGEGREDLYDMAGSAAEWLDLCDTENLSDPALTECYLGGGHLFFEAQFNRCNWIDTAPRELDSQFAGIRCCADPL